MTAAGDDLTTKSKVRTDVDNDKTTVDPEHADDSTSRSKTKVELPRSPVGQYAVVSVTPLGTSCAQ